MQVRVFVRRTSWSNNNTFFIVCDNAIINITCCNLVVVVVVVYAIFAESYCGSADSYITLIISVNACPGAYALWLLLGDHTTITDTYVGISSVDIYTITVEVLDQCVSYIDGAIINKNSF